MLMVWEGVDEGFVVLLKIEDLTDELVELVAVEMEMVMAQNEVEFRVEPAVEAVATMVKVFLQ